MIYNDWIELGFTRVEIADSVEMKATGYGGYFLEKEIGKNMNIYVYWDNLDEPFLQANSVENEDNVLRQFVNVEFAINLAKLY